MVLFHDDNALVHLSAIAAAKLVKLLKELLPQPSYSLNLASSDFFPIFLKKGLGGKRFSSNSKIINTTNAYFVEIKISCSFEELKKLEHHWEKCIITKGNYVKE